MSDYAENKKKNKTAHRKKICILCALCFGVFLYLIGRLSYLMIGCSEYYTEKAQDLHERERVIKAARGKILDANGKVLATNRTVCTISVIHSQIEQPEQVIQMLARELSVEENVIRKRVEKVSAIEKIKSNVSKEIGDRIRTYEYAGVKVDEDFKRYYPYDTLASKVLGFTGGDNQGIIGLEVKYEEYLKGKNGTILAVTDAKGVEIPSKGEKRIEPVPGKDLQTSMDLNIQMYATQLAEQVMEKKQAEAVYLMVMNPQNGELYAMVNIPEFDLNNPYQLNQMDSVSANQLSGKEKQDALNRMWRNGCINDTYEPGSTAKIITAAAGLEAGVVSLEDTFHCPGYIVVEDRRIRCHKTTGHGSEDFLHGTMNSCNPVFVTIGLRLGVEQYYKYFKQFGLLQKTGIDLPGEASTIMHDPKNMGLVELATVSFGQSFQITPIQLMTTAAEMVNGGNRVIPHFGVRVIEEVDTDTGKSQKIKRFQYAQKQHIVSEETSQTMRYLLEQVVENGGGKNAYIEGKRVGGKTATSQTLPRGSGRYISSFLGFAPADDPKIMALLIIHNPKGTYYGGQIAAPVVRQLFENILPYRESTVYAIEDN
ncbi:MAG: penicillin-binding transpeptidase domain-containing protein [Lachnospiraceae bacterium]|nr:penicillin-binding transpeptidase domain-containing protein [Lachnospiraceae bacterium]